MGFPPGPVGVGFALTGVAILGLLRKPLDRPDKPGSAGFAVAILGVSLWCLSLGADYGTADLELSVAAYAVLMLSTSLTGIGWFLLAVEYTNRRRLTAGFVAPLAAFVLVEQVLVWTNPLHGQFLTPETTMAGPILVADFGVVYWFQATINYGLILVGIGVFGYEWARTTGLRRRQTGLLLLASLPAFAANLITVSGVLDTPYDVSPIGFVVTGLLLAVTLYRAEFLDVVPVARQAAMERMADAVVTVDGDNSLVDWNDAAGRTFGIADDSLGTPAAAVFEPLLGDDWDRIADLSDAETHVATTVDGERREFSLAISSVEAGENAGLGRVFVWRDVTALMRQEAALQARERKLDLLRQVMSRVLRHNLRNELTIVQGHADLIQNAADDDEIEAAVASIKRASDDLLAISEKARTIERIVDADVEVVELDLAAVAAAAARDVRAGYPDVSVDVTGAESCPVRASTDLGIAVRNLVENAAEYNDADDPRVAITVVDGEPPSLTVADNGPGIPDDEVAVLDAGRETPLDHGSGIGLWLVTWVVENSRASMCFDSDETGTVVTIEFQDPVPDGGDQADDGDAGDEGNLADDSNPADEGNPADDGDDAGDGASVPTEA